MTPGVKQKMPHPSLHGLMYLASPKHFDRIAACCLPWLTTVTICLFVLGLTWALYGAPADYQQGEAFRILYVHVPAAALSLMVYVVMALAAAVYSIWKVKLADSVALVSAPIGATFTALALITGAIWGKPMWGTGWIWDARLTSELILLLLYLGYIGLRGAIPQPARAAQASGILAWIGLVDIPIIHYSVTWWHTLHQGPTLFQLHKPSIAAGMLYPLLVLLLAFFMYYLTLLTCRLRLGLRGKR